jgi:hypothetical protein
MDAASQFSYDMDGEEYKTWSKSRITHDVFKSKSLIGQPEARSYFVGNIPVLFRKLT